MLTRTAVTALPHDNPPEELMNAFRRIGKHHRNSLVRRSARIVLGPSVIRVFRPGTNRPLRAALEQTNLAPLATLRGAGEFESWYARELDRVARAILRTNPNNPRIQPGYKWGHAAKVLSLFVCELLNCRYFTEQVSKRLECLAYVPIDRIALGHLKRLGILGFDGSIKSIDSQAKFELIQGTLGRAAACAGVPRVWFDDLWLVRSTDGVDG